ncbi:MAG TPA: hypothetical protein VM030_10960 [Acidimicrobiales bacterium]|nr:hypothetical protein [Acidimicrobiales bacterium]
MIDPFEAAALVRRDVELALVEAFPADDDGGFRLVDVGGNDDRPLTNETATVVPWTWSGVHRGRTDLVPYAPTERPVTVEGVTVVTEGVEGEPEFRRFVDWLGALGQIGVSLTDRPVFDDPSVLEGLEESADG